MGISLQNLLKSSPGEMNVVPVLRSCVLLPFNGCAPLSDGGGRSDWQFQERPVRLDIRTGPNGRYGKVGPGGGRWKVGEPLWLECSDAMVHAW